MKTHVDFVVIGAGICGLTIARKLSEEGMSVMLLEARERHGGRIRTVKWHFDKLVETGAEFVHGEAPLTRSLAKEANAEIVEMASGIYTSSDNQVFETADFIKNKERFMREIEHEEVNCTLTDFFKTHFTSEKDIELKRSVIRQAEGLDAADPDRISIFSLRNEWSKDDTPYIIKQGYGILSDFLLEKCMENGCDIHFSKTVKQITKKESEFFIRCSDGSFCTSSNAIITTPIGILCSPPDHPSHIDFIPGIPEQLSAAGLMGYGNVIKIIFEFKTSFWNKNGFKYNCAQLPDLGFLIGEGEFPICWANVESTVLTVWAGGKQTDHLISLEDDKLFDAALRSLCISFVTSKDFLREQLLNYKVYNWHKDTFAAGAYSYETPDTKASRHILSEIYTRGLFFAGEAFGTSTGTVEGALESAEATLKKILSPE